VYSSEVIVGLILALGLLALALYVGVRQVVLLRRLGPDSLPAEEYHYERRKARWRLASAALLLLMGCLLAGLQFYEARASELARRSEQHGGEPVPLTDQERSFLRRYIGSWIALLLVLLAVLVLAALDLWATRRYGLKQYRKLSEDRRAMIQRQVNRMRQDRNGEG
jgi:hypothetical protein